MFGKKKQQEPKKELTPMESALSKIRNAWIAAMLSMGVTCIFAVISLAGPTFAGIDAWAFVDVAFIGGLAYGLKRNSRTCATVLLVYFIGSKLLMWAELGKPSGVPMALIITYFYIQGVIGTFKYHKLKGEAAVEPDVDVNPAT